MRILVVEDFEAVRKAVCQALEEDGFVVDSASDGREGLHLAETGEYDVLILDVMLPGLDGFELLQRARRSGNSAPALFLTAKTAVDDRVRGLDLGADDYLVKPFAMEELLARVRSCVRRRYDRAETVLRVGPLALDLRAHLVHVADRVVDLTAREYALLEYLTLRAGEVVSRTDIWRHVYDDLTETTSNVVDVYIGYLRRKLNQAGAVPLIHTRRGEGYVLREPGR